MDYSDLDELMTDEDPDFDQAAEHLKQHHSELMPDDLLELYAYYKQGTEGDCNTSKPGIFQMQGRAKWNAWNQVKGLSQENAKKKYIEKITQLFPTWRSSKSLGPAVSRPQEELFPQHEKTLADFVKENDPDLPKILSTLNEEINALDEESGMGLIHWCSDRGHLATLNILLQHPLIDVNLKDSEGQTSLHYASSCGHLECIKALVTAGADQTLLDEEGSSILDVAYDQSIQQFIQSL